MKRDIPAQNRKRSKSRTCLAMLDKGLDSEFISLSCECVRHFDYPYDPAGERRSLKRQATRMSRQVGKRVCRENWEASIEASLV